MSHQRCCIQHCLNGSNSLCPPLYMRDPKRKQEWLRNVNAPIRKIRLSDGARVCTIHMKDLRKRLGDSFSPDRSLDRSFQQDSDDEDLQAPWISQRTIKGPGRLLRCCKYCNYKNIIASIMVRHLRERHPSLRGAAFTDAVRLQVVDENGVPIDPNGEYDDDDILPISKRVKVKQESPEPRINEEPDCRTLISSSQKKSSIPMDDCRSIISSKKTEHSRSAIRKDYHRSGSYTSSRSSTASSQQLRSMKSEKEDKNKSYSKDVDKKEGYSSKIDQVTRSVYMCDLCGFWAQAVELFHRHRVVEHHSEANDPAFLCSGCDFRSQDRKSLINHIDSKHMSKDRAGHPKPNARIQLRGIPNHRYASFLKDHVVVATEACGRVPSSKKKEEKEVENIKEKKVKKDSVASTEVKENKWKPVISSCDQIEEKESSLISLKQEPSLPEIIEPIVKVKEEEPSLTDGLLPVRIIHVDQPLSSEPVAKRRRLELKDEMLDQALPEMERDTCSGEELLEEETACRRQMVQLDAEILEGHKQLTAARSEMIQKADVLRERLRQLQEKGQASIAATARLAEEKEALRQHLTGLLVQKVKAELAVQTKKCDELQYRLAAMQRSDTEGQQVHGGQVGKDLKLAEADLEEVLREIQLAHNAEQELDAQVRQEEEWKDSVIQLQVSTRQELGTRLSMGSEKTARLKTLQRDRVQAYADLSARLARIIYMTITRNAALWRQDWLDRLDREGDSSDVQSLGIFNSEAVVHLVPSTVTIEQPNSEESNGNVTV